MWSTFFVFKNSHAFSQRCPLLRETPSLQYLSALLVDISCAWTWPAGLLPVGFDEQIKLDLRWLMLIAPEMRSRESANTLDSSPEPPPPTPVLELPLRVR